MAVECHFVQCLLIVAEFHPVPEMLMLTIKKRECLVIYGGRSIFHSVQMLMLTIKKGTYSSDPFMLSGPNFFSHLLSLTKKLLSALHFRYQFAKYQERERLF